MIYSRSAAPRDEGSPRLNAESGPVLVTGANGHLGRRLLTRLASQGVPARAVVRSERAAASLSDLPGKPETRVLAYDDVPGLTRVASGCRGAVHLVGIIKEGATSTYQAAHEDTTRASLLALVLADLSVLREQ